jgi:hypothetical protein
MHARADLVEQIGDLGLLALLLGLERIGLERVEVRLSSSCTVDERGLALGIHIEEVKAMSISLSLG